MRRATLLAIAVPLLLAGCGKASPTEPSAAELTVSVSPLPLVVRWACPQHAPEDPPPSQCFLTMDPTISVRESGGVGGRVVSMAVSVRNANNEGLFGITLDRNWILDNAGTDRIEANRTVSFRVLVNEYPLPFAARPNLKLAIGARVVDDKGNELTPGLQLDIN